MATRFAWMLEEEGDSYVNLNDDWSLQIVDPTGKEVAFPAVTTSDWARLRRLRLALNAAIAFLDSHA